MHCCNGFCISVLLNDLGNDAGTDRSAALADSEAETFFDRDGLDQLDRHRDVVAGHNHFNAFGKLDGTRNVRRTDEELRTIVVEECRVTAALVLGQNVDLSLENGSRGNGAGLCDNLTLLNVRSVDTTKQSTDVIASHSFVELLVEHFKTGDGRRARLVDEADDLGGITDVRYATLNSARSNRAAAGDGEDVLDGKKERLLVVALRRRNVAVDGIHEFKDALALGSCKNFLVGAAARRLFKRFERGTLDDRNVVAGELVGAEQLAVKPMY